MQFSTTRFAALLSDATSATIQIAKGDVTRADPEAIKGEIMASQYQGYPQNAQDVPYDPRTKNSMQTKPSARPASQEGTMAALMDRLENLVGRAEDNRNAIENIRFRLAGATPQEPSSVTALNAVASSIIDHFETWLHKLERAVDKTQDDAKFIASKLG